MQQQSYISGFQEIIDLMDLGEIDEAINSNWSLIAENVLERNQQAVNSILLSTYLINTLPDPTQDQALQTIALLTPWIGGKAVYQARILMGVDPDENGLPYRLESTINTPEQRTILNVFPNPAHNILNIELMNDSCEYKLSLYSGTGSLVFINIYSGNTRLDLSHYPNGIYWIRYEPMKLGSIETKRIVLIR